MAFTAGTVATAAQLNAANVKIVQGSGGPTGAFAGSTTATVLTGTSVTITVPTGGAVKVTVMVPDISFTTAGFSVAQIRARRGGSPIGIAASLFELTSSRLTTSSTFWDTPAAGTYTYDLDRIAGANAGSYSINNAGAYLILETFGPA